MSRKAAAAWPPPKLALLEAQLDRLVAAVRDSSQRDVDDQIWLTRFLVVRSCGYLEQAVHETVVAHLEHHSYGTAKSFAMSWLERSTNPSVENLLKLVGRLDHGMQTDLEELLKHNGHHLAQNLALLVGRRNQIAHGENEGMTTQAAIGLVDVAREIANWFILRLDPATPPSHRLAP